jgi:hypothetical protein
VATAFEEMLAPRALRLRLDFDPVHMVRCLLDGAFGEMTAVRYVPAAEFGLWEHLMRSRHHRTVILETVSIWLPEAAAMVRPDLDIDELDAVLRFEVTLPGPGGFMVPSVRFFAAETYHEARAALLSHFPGADRALVTTAGYFLPPALAQLSH